MKKSKKRTIWITLLVSALVVAIGLGTALLVIERTYPGAIARRMKQSITWFTGPRLDKEWKSKPPTADLDGIDVSHHNGKIDWQKVSQNKKVKFVYAKATEGATHTDTQFKRNAKEARKYGIKFGAYHFFTMASARGQFDNFRKMVSRSDIDLIPVIDFEKTYGKTTKELCDTLEELCKLMEKHYGHKPMIYTSEGLYANVLKKRFGNYQMWISRYYTKPVVRHTLWQYSERGKVTGVGKYGLSDVNKFAAGKGLKDIEM